MTVQLDHLTIPSANRHAAARLLAEILGVTWGAAAMGPFTAVYVNDGLTIDFDEWIDPFAQGHYCFRVNETMFDAIVARLATLGIAYRSLPHGPDDGEINTTTGGRVVYWRAPDGHVWELLTQSYARHPGDAQTPG